MKDKNEIMNTNLVITLNRIINLEDNFSLDMSGYISIPEGSPTESHYTTKGQVHPCGTTYCILGILAKQDGYPEEFRIRGIEFNYKSNGTKFNHKRYGNHMLSQDTSKTYRIGLNELDLHNILFHHDWIDSLSQAKERAQFLLDRIKSISEGDNRVNNEMDYFFLKSLKVEKFLFSKILVYPLFNCEE